VPVTFDSAALRYRDRRRAVPRVFSSLGSGLTAGSRRRRDSGAPVRRGGSIEDVDASSSASTPRIGLAAMPPTPQACARMSSAGRSGAPGSATYVPSPSGLTDTPNLAARGSSPGRSASPRRHPQGRPRPEVHHCAAPPDVTLDGARSTRSPASWRDPIRSLDRRSRVERANYRAVTDEDHREGRRRWGAVPADSMARSPASAPTCRSPAPGLEDLGQAADVCRTSSAADSRAGGDGQAGVKVTPRDGARGRMRSGSTNWPPRSTAGGSSTSTPRSNWGRALHQAQPAVGRRPARRARSPPRRTCWRNWRKRTNCPAWC
jgi:hypothetical protein